VSAIDSFKFVLGECFETSLPISGLFLFEGLAVNLGFFPRSVENGIVAISHVFRPCQFSKRRILTLTDMVQLIGISIAIPRRISFANQVGVVVLRPLIVIGKFVP